MAFQRLEYERVWTVDDEDEKGFRTYQDSEQQVREDLQYHPDAIKHFINGLLDVLESSDAADLIGDGKKGRLADTLNDLYTEIDRLDNELLNVTTGGLPGALRGSLVNFSAGSWQVSDNGYTLTLNQEAHGRENATFGYRLWARVNGVWCSDVWAVAGTQVDHQSDTDTIVLTAEEPYEGKISFFGV